MTRLTPSFITFTGVDDPELLPQMSELSRRFPIEWGVLLDPEQTDDPLFPTQAQIDVVRKSGLRLSAHVCGAPATAIARGLNCDLDLSGFARVQVNHGRDGADETVVQHVAEFAAARGVRGALQCSGDFPTDDARVDWLFDVSFGEGVRPTAFPRLTDAIPFCGYSGGIGPDTVARLLEERFDVSANTPFWIDMESGVRTEHRLDLAKCAAVCSAVYE